MPNASPQVPEDGAGEDSCSIPCRRGGGGSVLGDGGVPEEVCSRGSGRRSVGAAYRAPAGPVMALQPASEGIGGGNYAHDQAVSSGRSAPPRPASAVFTQNGLYEPLSSGRSAPPRPASAVVATQSGLHRPLSASGGRPAPPKRPASAVELRHFGGPPPASSFSRELAPATGGKVVEADLRVGPVRAVGRGCCGLDVQDARLRHASAVRAEAMLVGALSDVRSRPRAWREDHQITFGSTKNAQYMPEHREYFDREKLVDIEHFVTELLESSRKGPLARTSSARDDGAAELSLAAAVGDGAAPVAAAAAPVPARRLPEEDELEKAATMTEALRMASLNRVAEAPTAGRARAWDSRFGLPEPMCPERRPKPWEHCGALARRSCSKPELGAQRPCSGAAPQPLPAKDHLLEATYGRPLVLVSGAP